MVAREDSLKYLAKRIIQSRKGQWKAAGSTWSNPARRAVAHLLGEASKHYPLCTFLNLLPDHDPRRPQAETKCLNVTQVTGVTTSAIAFVRSATDRDFHSLLLSLAITLTSFWKLLEIAFSHPLLISLSSRDERISNSAISYQATMSILIILQATIASSDLWCFTL